MDYKECKNCYQTAYMEDCKECHEHDCVCEYCGYCYKGDHE